MIGVMLAPVATPTLFEQFNALTTADILGLVAAQVHTVSGQIPSMASDGAGGDPNPDGIATGLSMTRCDAAEATAKLTS